MSRLICMLLFVTLSLSVSPASAAGIDTQQVIAEQLELNPADAALYWDGLSLTIVSFVAQGRRVAIDGLGAFEPIYVNDGAEGVKRSMRFTFDLGPAIEQPGTKSVFDEELLQAFRSFGWLEATGGKVARRLEGDEWSNMLDLFVFCVLRNIDGQSSQPLGMGLGNFFPIPEINLSTQRDNSERRVIIDFVADDDSPEKFAWQYDFSVEALTKTTAALDKQAVNLHRFARLTGIREYTNAALIVESVSKSWTAELSDLTGGGTKAQDHNSSRSNKTASVFDDGVDDLEDALDEIKKAAAQDHNSSRSNKTASAIDEIGGGGAWASEVLAQPAQDHNSSRSNKTASKSPDFYNELVGRYDGAYQTRAQDHNSSRSNKTASVAADFEPSPELEELFRSLATF